MIRLRPYKRCDSKIIEKWVQDKEVFMKWGGNRFGEFPVTAQMIDDKYTLNNGDCVEKDNFYPWVALDNENHVVGHFIMRYLNGDNKLLRFGWVIVDDSRRGKGYGTEMLQTGLKYAFDILGVNTVTIGVFENNVSAHKCYQKAGFADQKIVSAEPWNIIEMAVERQPGS